MAIVMGATMAVVLMAYMFSMYENASANVAIMVASFAMFSVALWLVRSQATVDQVSWMKAMIPHHSIAIMTSERAAITAPRAAKLADQIIETQRKEIDETKALINELQGRK